MNENRQRLTTTTVRTGFR